MTVFERSSAPWLAGLGALFLASGLGAVGLMRTAAGLQVQVNNFYTSQTADQQVSDDTYRYWETISQNAYTLQEVSTPVLMGCVTTVFVVLVMLARRWDLTRRESTAQADATAAS